MLYDPKWEKKATADLFDLRTLVAWLEAQPADREYDYNDCNGLCMVGQYMTAQGIEWDHLAFLDFAHAGFNSLAAGRPRTFGAALKRARAALSSTV